MTENNAIELNGHPTITRIAFSSAKLPKQYEAMVYSKWLRSLRFGNPIMKQLQSDVYYREYHKHITMLMGKPSSIVTMAVLSDDHDIVLGFCVTREDVLDYVHVHKDHRKQGIAKMIVPDDITTFTHITLTAMQIWRGNPKYKELKFNNFA